jgi:hypothetical protein
LYSVRSPDASRLRMQPGSCRCERRRRSSLYESTFYRIGCRGCRELSLVLSAASPHQDDFTSAGNRGLNGSQGRLGLWRFYDGDTWRWSGLSARSIGRMAATMSWYYLDPVDRVSSQDRATSKIYYDRPSPVFDTLCYLRGAKRLLALNPKHLTNRRSEPRRK